MRLLVPYAQCGIVAKTVLLFFRFAVFVPLAYLYRLLGLTAEDQELIFHATSILLLLIVAWRCRVPALLAVGGRSSRLLLAAFLGFASVLVLDSLVSSAAKYPYALQTQHILLIAFIILFAAKADSSWWRFLLAAVIACALVQSVCAIVLYITRESVFVSPGIGYRASGAWFGPNRLCYICMAASLLLIPLAIAEERPVPRLIYWLSAAVALTAMLLTFTRSGVLGFFVGASYLAWAEKHNKKYVFLPILGLLILIAVSLGRSTPETTGMIGVDRSALGRVQIWRVSVRMIADHWLFGVGHTAYFGRLAAYSDAKLDEYHPSDPEAKNLFLTMGSEHGILGLWSVALFIYAVWAVGRGKERDAFASWEWRLIQGIKATGAATLATSFVDTPFYAEGQFTMTFMWLLCVGFLLHLALSKTSLAPEYRLSMILRRVGIAVAALPILGFGALTSVGVLDARQALRSQHERVAASRQGGSFVSIDQVPNELTQAVISSEDWRFHRHNGFSLVDMHRALRVNIRSGRVRQGGSTITQQLAKNLFFTHDRALRRKVAELIVAVEMERRLGKDEILELYLNTIDFGMEDKRGVTMAAEHYFGKEVSRLTDAECALLAALIPYAPRKTISPEHAEQALLRVSGRLGESMRARVRREIDSVGFHRWFRQHIRPEVAEPAESSQSR